MPPRRKKGMRIITGRFKGRVFYPPPNLPARPTTDFARTAIFNILANITDFEGLHVLDLFAGTGAISIEFISRGAAHVTPVDKDHRCVQFIKQMKRELSITNLDIYKMDAFQFLKGCAEKYDLIFAGPPYALDREIRKIHEFVFRYERLKPGGILIIEHHKSTPMNDLPFLIDQREYGSSVFSFFKNGEHNPNAQV